MPGNSKYFKDHDNDAPYASFKVGDLVEKTSGYQFCGVVVAVFKKLSGEVRFVVELTAPGASGMLHIFNATQLKHRIDSITITNGGGGMGG